MAMMRNNNDENAILHPNKSLTTGNKTPAATSKTPAAATKTRRAFGDISNRKKGEAGQANKSIALGKTPANTLKLAPTNKKTPFQTTTKRRVNFALPPVEAEAETAAPKPVSLECDDVDDIEQPAGRLWIQQQALLDAEDDTDVMSLEGAATMAQDLRTLLKQRHELRVQMEVEEFERLLADDDDPPFADVFLQDGK
jgi:Fe-S cluster biosynthesis and repair protein YggX